MASLSTATSPPHPHCARTAPSRDWALDSTAKARRLEDRRKGFWVGRASQYPPSSGLCVLPHFAVDPKNEPSVSRCSERASVSRRSSPYSPCPRGWVRG